MTRDAEVAVVGAGAVGCGAARELAPDHDVVVLEKGRPAAEATGLSAGVVCPAAYYPETPAIAAASIEFFESFDGSRAFEFERRERVDLVTEEGAPTFRERARRLADAGLPVAFLDREALREAYPEVDASGFAGALEYRDTGWVDPHSFATALLEDAESEGAAVLTETRVEDVRVEAGSVAGVETDAGVVGAEHVVVAAGWRTQPLLADRVELPIRPWEFSIATLEPAGGVGGLPMGRAVSEGIYFRPERNGDLLVGDGERPARDPELKSAGADAGEAFREAVASFVPEVLPGFGDAELTNHWTGIEGITPDARPIVDAPGPEGLVVAQASALGIMTAPPMARGVRALVTGEDPGFPLEPFRVDRFESRSPDFETGGVVGDAG